MSRSSVFSRIVSLFASVALVMSFTPFAWAEDIGSSDASNVHAAQSECEIAVSENSGQDIEQNSFTDPDCEDCEHLGMIDDESPLITYEDNDAIEQPESELDEEPVLKSTGLFSTTQNDRTVYLARSNGTIYHYSSACSGMVSPIPVTLQEALNRGCRPCKTCVAPPQSISGATVTTSSSSVVYSGYAQEPTVTVRLNGKTLQAGSDYDVSYSNNINPGTATVTVTGKYDYTGTASTTFTITARSLSTGSIDSIPNIVSTGKTQRPPVTVRCGGRVLKANTDYSIAYSNNSAPGTATVTVTGKGGYTGTLSTTFKIVQSDIKFGSTPYHIASRANTRFVLDVANAIPVAGSNVSIWTNNGGTNQLFTIEVASDGNVVLRNVANPSLVLDAAGATPQAGANVSTWTSNGGLNQEWFICSSGSGYYTIASASDPELILDAAGYPPSIGANVGLWTSNGGTNQQWFFAEASAVDPVIPEVIELGKVYRIVSASDEAFILDVAKAIPVAGSNVSIWTNNDGLNQLFKVEPTFDGYVVLRNEANPALVLDAAGATPKAGANVSTWTDNGGMNQKWVLRANESGTITIASAANPDFVLDAAGSSPEIGANVGLWTDNGGKNQQWRFISKDDLRYASATVSGMERNASGKALSPDVTAKLNGRDLHENQDYIVKYDGQTEAPTSAGTYAVTLEGIGSYFGTCELGELTIYPAPVKQGSASPFHLASGFDDRFVLDVAKVMPEAGSNVSIWTNNGGTNQMFTFELQDSGYYVLRNVANTSLVLDAAGAVPKTGANISTWTYNQGLNQQWVLIPSESSPGYYSIHSASNTGFVLDAAGSTPEIGANVGLWTFNGGANQLWKLTS